MTLTSGARVAGPPASLNREVAAKLREAAELLGQQGANPFRVGAYRRAAETVARLPRDLHAVVAEEGLDGLIALPHVGRGIARAIEEILRTGRWSLLDRLRGTVDPVTVFRTVPGVGPRLAQRFHDSLGVDTLEALEVAAHDGRLEGVAGLGPRRAAALRAALASMLGRVRREVAPVAGRPVVPVARPPVGVLLDVDREYREKADAGRLATITPRRFNPEGKAWLPILHSRRGSWHFTALYSNTAAAHQLGRTHDWVVVYSYDDHHQEGQHTIVTETRGPLRGRRVVRGREDECREHYASAAPAKAGPALAPRAPSLPARRLGPGSSPAPGSPSRVGRE
jgi:putative hydrolase